MELNRDLLREYDSHMTCMWDHVTLSSSRRGPERSDVSNHSSVPPTSQVTLTPSLPHTLTPSHSNPDDKLATTYVQDYQSNVQESLSGLLLARPHHVSCLTSNDSQTPGHFDKEAVGSQIQSMAVFETVNLMQCGEDYIIMM